MPGSIFASTSKRSTAKTVRPIQDHRLVKITGERPGDTTVTYDKGGWVFWMLLNQMGRDRALAGVQAFIKAYQGNSDHPVLQDFLASMHPFASDAAAFDAFTHQWFFEVVMPSIVWSRPRKTTHRERLGGDCPARKCQEWVHAIDVAVTQESGSPKTERPSRLPARHSANLTLGKGESRDVVITCPFEPERIIVDPDAKVLQLRRKNAVAKLHENTHTAKAQIVRDATQSYRTHLSCISLRNFLS